MEIQLDALLIGILVIAGIVALIKLAQLFSELAGTIKRINSTLDCNREGLDQAVKKIPNMVNNIDGKEK